MEIVTIGVLVLLALGLVVYSALPRGGGGQDAIQRRLEGRKQTDDSVEIRQKAKEQATQRIVKKATPYLSRLIMPVKEEELTQLRAKLIAGGYRHPQAQTIFMASKTIAAAILAIVGLSIGASLGYGAGGVIGTTALGAGLGFVGPGFWLGRVTKGRQDRVRRGLPDVLDLLVVSVESGLALDAAIKRVGEEMALVHPDISDEFRIATREAQMGIPRSAALDNMATRCGVDELRSLVSVVAQAERFGTSIAKALRNQGEAMRAKRRLQAEERAQKTAVKLMIPLVMFIFPAMGIVLAGPAAINLMEAFAK